MRIIETPTSWTSVYDTLDEARSAANKLHWPGASSHDGDVSFRGTATYAEADALIKTGLPDLGRQIAVESTKIAVDLFSKTPHPDISYDVQGQVIDMGRYLEGDPYCVLNMAVEDAGIKRTCEIVVNMTFNCSVNEKEVLTRGTAIASIIKTLEAQGISCRIWLCHGSHKNGETVSAWIKFKDFGEPLRINQLAFMVCHLSSERRLGFSLVEMGPEKLRQKIGVTEGGGYGRACEADQWGKIPVDLAKCLYFRIADNLPEFASPEKARAYVSEVVGQKMGAKNEMSKV